MDKKVNIKLEAISLEALALVTVALAILQGTGVISINVWLIFLPVIIGGGTQVGVLVVVGVIMLIKRISSFIRIRRYKRG
jgi:NhaP-type Na+/H+ or K+/H+ antiporter